MKNERRRVEGKEGGWRLTFSEFDKVDILLKKTKSESDNTILKKFKKEEMGLLLEKTSGTIEKFQVSFLSTQNKQLVNQFF